MGFQPVHFLFYKRSKFGCGARVCTTDFQSVDQRDGLEVTLHFGPDSAGPTSLLSPALALS